MSPQLPVLMWPVIAKHALLVSHLEKGGLRQLGTLEELDSFCTADKSISIFVCDSKPVVKQVNISHLTGLCQSTHNRRA